MLQCFQRHFRLKDCFYFVIRRKLRLEQFDLATFLNKIVCVEILIEKIIGTCIHIISFFLLNILILRLTTSKLIITLVIKDYYFLQISFHPSNKYVLTIFGFQMILLFEICKIKNIYYFDIEENRKEIVHVYHFTFVACFVMIFVLTSYAFLKYCLRVFQQQYICQLFFFLYEPVYNSRRYSKFLGIKNSYKNGVCIELQFCLVQFRGLIVKVSI